jgi:GTP cyclohydrolase II
MLRAIGVQRIRLITSNPGKVAKLECAGIEVVECRRTGTFVMPFDRDYLAAKIALSGHTLRL